MRLEIGKGNRGRINCAFGLISLCSAPPGHDAFHCPAGEVAVRLNAVPPPRHESGRTTPATGDRHGSLYQQT